MEHRSLPKLLREAERRVNARVFRTGGDDTLASIPADRDRDVDLLLMEAADMIEAMASVGIRQESEIERLRAEVARLTKIEDAVLSDLRQPDEQHSHWCAVHIGKVCNCRSDGSKS